MSRDRSRERSSRDRYDRGARRRSRSPQKDYNSGARDGFKLQSGLPSLSAQGAFAPMGKAPRKPQRQNKDTEFEMSAFRTSFKKYCEEVWNVKDGLRDHFDKGAWKDVPETAYSDRAYQKKPFINELKWDFSKDPERPRLFKDVTFYGRLEPHFFKRNEGKDNAKSVFGQFGFILDVKNEKGEDVNAKSDPKYYTFESFRLFEFSTEHRYKGGQDEYNKKVKMDKYRHEFNTLSKKIVDNDLSVDSKEYIRSKSLERKIKKDEFKNFPSKLATMDVLEKDPTEPLFPLKPVIPSGDDDNFYIIRDLSKLQKRAARAKKRGVVDKIFWHFSKLDVTDPEEWGKEKKYAKLYHRRVKFEIFLGLYDKRAEARNIELIERFPWEKPKKDKIDKAEIVKQEAAELPFHDTAVSETSLPASVKNEA